MEISAILAKEFETTESAVAAVAEKSAAVMLPRPCPDPIAS